MPYTYDKISTTTLGSSATDITFSSIPGTYTDLRLVISGTIASPGSIYYAQLNGDTGTNYSRTFIRGTNASASMNRAANQTTMYLANGGGSTTVPTFSTLDIFSYAGSDFKSALATAAECLNSAGQVTYLVNLWRSTAAVTSIKIFTDYNLNAGTSATIYGILKA